MKFLDVVADASSLITLTNACLYEVLTFLKNTLNMRVFITEGVYYETVEHPLHLHTPIYKFSAMQIKESVEQGVIIKVDRDGRLKKITEELLEYGNNMFFMRGRPVELVHEGEIEMLALAIANDVPFVLMDEVMTRLMVENPAAIKLHLEKEFNVNVMVDKRNLRAFHSLTENVNVIRSAELLALAFRHGYFNKFAHPKDMFLAALTNVRVNGCGMRLEEIEELKKAWRL